MFGKFLTEITLLQWGRFTIGLHALVFTDLAVNMKQIT